MVKKKAKKTFTTLDPIKFRKKLEDEEKLFELEMMGGESDKKGFEFVDEYGRRLARQQKAQDDINQEKLHKSRRGTKYNYFARIAQISIKMIHDYSDLPRFFQWGVYPTKKGVVYWIKNLKGEVFRSAFTPVGIANIDLLGGVYSKVRQLENTAIRERDRLKVTVVEDGAKKSPGGIILPN